MVAHCKALAHVDVSRLLFGMTQARTGEVHGLQARVTPLRFRGGQLTRRRRGVLPAKTDKPTGSATQPVMIGLDG